MADFVSNFWHWFIVIPTVIGILALFPLVILNRGEGTGDKPETMGHVWDEDLEEYNNPLPRWWLNLFYITIIFGVAYLVLYPGLGKFEGILGWTSKGEYQSEIAAAEKEFGPIFKKYASDDIAALAKNPEAIKTGERLFVNYCATCHGADARGALGYPNLRDQDWLYGGKPEQIKTSILNGRNGMMPGWQAALGEEGVKNTTEFVLSLSKTDVDLESARAGRKHFNTMCLACHGPDGRGNQALGGPNLTDEVWLYGGSRKEIVRSISAGRQGKMPPHRDFLGEDKVHVLTAYIYGLSNGPRQ